jgi:predicted MFS family arabinose efflux permease
MTTSLPPQQERYLLLTLMGLQFTHIVDFMIIMPLGPQFTALWHINATQFGWLVASYTFAAGLSGLMGAFYIDRLERKRLLLVLYAGFTVSTVACGLCHSYEQLVFARVACGGFGGLLTALSQTMVGDVIPFERRGKAMALVMLAFSLATVVGVPSALFIAQIGGWQLPFLLLGGLCVVLMGLAMQTLPVLRSHLDNQDATSAFYTTRSSAHTTQALLRDFRTWQAFGFSALLMFTGFTVIPFITLYLQHNAVLPASTIPWVYTLGGVATLISTPQIGQWADRFGKARIFTYLSWAAMLPLLGVTVCAGAPTWVILLITTSFFVLVNGRVAPGMALLTAAVAPPWRGRFLSLNAAVQSGTLGVAAWVGSHLIEHRPDGHLMGYWHTGVVACISSCLCILVLRHMTRYVMQSLKKTA